MKNCMTCLTCVVALFVADMSVCIAATAGQPSGDELTIATGGRTKAVVVVSPTAKDRERRAADDLVKYIGLMCGAEPAIADTRPAIDAAMRGKSPLLVLGQESLAANPKLRDALKAVVKKNPHLQSEGIVLRREGKRVYLVGNNDLGHYFAVAELLRLWGCRWYMPTEIGECIPEERDLKVGDLDYAYSSPFEIRSYWISWVGDNTGAEEFQMRNMMTGRSAMPPTGHALGKYTKGLGKGTFNFPITAPETARHVAEQVQELYAQGKPFSLGMEDGSYDSDHPKDRELMKLQWDKYFLRWSVTDPMLELYNNVARILQKKHPASKGKIGFLAYANMTIPPVRDMYRVSYRGKKISDHPMRAILKEYGGRYRLLVVNLDATELDVQVRFDKKTLESLQVHYESRPLKVNDTKDGFVDHFGPMGTHVHSFEITSQ